MSEETFWRVVAVFSIIVAGMVGALWKHIVDDGKVRERLATLEADSATTKTELKSLRERLHDLREDWTREIHQKLKDWKEDLLELFGRGK